MQFDQLTLISPEAYDIYIVPAKPSQKKMY